MHVVISISVISFCLVISLTCGIIMWLMIGKSEKTGCEGVLCVFIPNFADK